MSERDTGKFYAPSKEPFKEPAEKKPPLPQPGLWAVEQNEESVKGSRLDFQSKFPTTANFLVCLGVGFMYGFLSQRAGVSLPSVVINQFLFRDFTVLKFLLSAVGGSMAVHCALSLPLGTQEHFRLVRAYNKSKKGLVTTFLGASLLGIGIAMTGSCPGQAVNQVGQGFYWALFTVAGGLFGAFVYGLMEDRLSRSSWWNEMAMPPERDTLDKWMKLPYWLTSLFCIGAVSAALYILEKQFPFVATSGVHWLLQERWAPQLAGFSFGLLQLPFTLASGRTLGSSLAYAVLASHIGNFISPLAARTNSFFVSRLSGRANWIQPMYLLGGLIGAFLASALAGTNNWIYPTLEIDTGPVMSFIGGALLTFGSLLAGGCPTGHGITGMSQLFFSSFTASIAMFLGGTITAFVLNSRRAYVLPL